MDGCYGDDTLNQMVKNGSPNNFFLAYLDTHTKRK